MPNRPFSLLVATAFAALSIGSVVAAPVKKLVLVGGGDRPPGAMAQYATWAGGPRAEVLIIGWASAQPEVYFETMSADLRAQGVTNFVASLTGPATPGDVAAFTRDFQQKIAHATAVFFTGGDQTKHMRVINLPGIRSMLEKKYAAGYVFGGTSAGMAIMSHWMLTGEGSNVEPGLGLLPTGILADQHARREGRLERDLKAMRANSIPYGALIDETNAIAMIDEREFTVYGPTFVKILSIDSAGTTRGIDAHDHECVDVRTWQVEARCATPIFRR
jgi:cyanophycinase